MKGAAKAVTGLLVMGAVVLMTWRWLDGYFSQQASAAHRQTGKAYAARVLEVVGTLPDELRESSGLAVSRTQPGVLWSHNDSGDGPNLYAIDLSGRLLAIVPVTEASARDWEDIASGPCPPTLPSTTSPEKGAPSPACLYVADTGNNDGGRNDLTVYVLVEPVISRTGSTPPMATAQSFRYRYPGRPEDSEAIAVLPTGDVTIVSKGRTGSIDFFAIAAAQVARGLASGEVLTAMRTGGTDIQPDARIGRLVTGAAVSPDGTTLAVRTYTEVFFFGAVENGRRWRDLRRPCFLGDAEPQGEAIDYLDGETLLLTSERARGRPGTIHRLRC
jgi:hypothetical protein